MVDSVNSVKNSGHSGAPALFGRDFVKGAGILKGVAKGPGAAFTALQGGVSRVGSSVRQRLGPLQARVVAVKTNTVPRALRPLVCAARDIKRCVDSLLNNLKQVFEPKAQRLIAQAALDLAGRINGDLTSLGEALKSSLGKLTGREREVLGQTVTELTSNEASLAEVLNHVPPTRQKQTANVLTQVLEQGAIASERRTGASYQKRLSNIYTRLPTESVGKGTPEQQDQLKEALRSINFWDVRQGNGARQLQTDFRAIITTGKDAQNWATKLDNAWEVLGGRDTVGLGPEKAILDRLELLIQERLFHFKVDLTPPSVK